MGAHLISVLGTSLYEPVVYEDSDRRSEDVKAQEFIQIALMEQFRNELLAKDGKITIFLTEQARRQNWLNRFYTKKEEEIASRRTDANQVKDGGTKIGLEQQLRDKYPEYYEKLEVIDISDGVKKEQIDEIFQKMYECIRPKSEDFQDEIIFDITHSFRSIPMLAITVLNYARVLKECTLKGIYYGAYEAAPRDVVDVKRAPIFDLTTYDEILQWTSAADAFMRYGNAQQMREVYNSRMKNASIAERKELGSIDKVIKGMEYLSDAISTGRGLDVKKAAEKMPDKVSAKHADQRSIRNSYQMLERKCENLEPETSQKIKPLYPLLEKARKTYRCFDKQENYQIGIEMVRWSLENHMTQQGYTALEETIKTFLCYCFELDDTSETNRDKIVGALLNGIGHYIKDRSASAQVKEMDVWEYLRTDRDCKDFTIGEKAETYKGMVERIPEDYAKLTQQVKDRRNDINHMGFRPNPATSEQLRNDLEKYFSRFEELVQRMLTTE